MNVVCTGDGRFVEVQGTARASPSTAPNSTRSSTSPVSGCADLTAAQHKALGALAG